MTFPVILVAALVLSWIASGRAFRLRLPFVRAGVYRVGPLTVTIRELPE